MSPIIDLTLDAIPLCPTTIGSGGYNLVITRISHTSRWDQQVASISSATSGQWPLTTIYHPIIIKIHP